MSLENTDSTEDRVDTKSNQFFQEQNPPPLISNSPPPHLEDINENESPFNSNSIGSFQNKPNLSDLDSSQNSCNTSLPNMKSMSFVGVNESIVDNVNTGEQQKRQELPEASQNSIASKILESLDDDWDAFNTDQGTESSTNNNVDSENDMKADVARELNQIDTVFDPFNANQVAESNEDTSGWASFDQNAFTFPSSGTKANEEDFFGEKENIIPEQNKEVKAEISDLDKKDVVVDEDEDDDFGEIVELETKVMPVKEAKPSIESLIQHNLDSSIEKVLKLCPADINGSDSKCYNLENEEFLIETNETWQQLQALASTTDESDSLQFKWSSSHLVTDYLNSLNMTRVLPQIKRDWSFNNILQPVKINVLTSSTDNNSKALETTDLPKTPTTNPSNAQFTDFESLKLTDYAQNTPNIVNTTPLAADIDLSFFDTRATECTKKSQDPKSTTPSVAKSTKMNLENGSSINVKNNQITGISSAKLVKQEASSKIYLDSLLADIFNKPDTANQQKKDDDFFAGPDKKSLSSSSTSSSISNISDQSIQLQPKNLELFIQQDLINARHTYDARALKISSRLPPNTTLGHSKFMVSYPVTK